LSDKSKKGVGGRLTLRELRLNLGWTMKRLAQEAGTSPGTVLRAERGETLSVPNAKKIADGLSKGYGKEIRVTDIVGLNIQ
jgi:transcriptional regulator with XRE-family HTH domain